MPKISDEKKEARRAQILDAAWRCFQREGLHQTTMQDIIQACGLSAGAVYSYFATKEDLIARAIETSLAEIARRLEPIFERSPLPTPGTVVAAIGAEIAGFARRDGFDLRSIALLGWSEAQRNPRLHAAMAVQYAAFLDRLEAVARRWQRDGVLRRGADPRSVAAALQATILGHIVQTMLVDGVTAKDIGKGFDGLAAAV